MKRTKLALVSLVVLVSCEKQISDNPLSGREPKSTQINNSSTTNVVVTASTPPASISDDLSVIDPSGTEVTIISASDYNGLDSKSQIFYTGLNNAAMYLLQDEANQATNLQFNADGSYSITVNPTLTTNPTTYSGECYACNRSSAFSCLYEIAMDMIIHNSYITVATITRVGGGCMKINYSTYKGYLYIPPTNNEGPVVETYNPVPTYPNSEFDSYINAVKLWGASHQGSGPTGGGPISHPEMWTRQELVGYIESFNADPSHSTIDHQTNAEFQLQLGYYIIYVMTDTPPFTPSIN